MNQALKSWLSPITRLHLSVMFGWLVVLFYLVVPALSGNEVDLLTPIILLSLRYSVFKPIDMIGSALSGWLLFSFWDYIFNNARNRDATGGALFVIIIFGLFFVFIKGAVLSAYFLIRETYMITKYYRTRSTHTQSGQVFSQVAATTETPEVTPERKVLLQSSDSDIIQQPILDNPIEGEIPQSHFDRYFAHLGHSSVATAYHDPTGDTHFLWNFYQKDVDISKSGNSLLLISGKEKGRDLFIDQFCKTHSQVDPYAVYKIVFGDPSPGIQSKWLGGAMKDIDLSSDSQYDDIIGTDLDEFRNMTLEARIFFTETYFKMLAAMRNVTLKDLFPNGVDYDPNTESPLKGYANKIENSPHKDFLESYTHNFGMKSWHETESGYCRFIPSYLTPAEKALLLFETIWEMYSIPALFSFLNSPHYHILHIEIPNEVILEGEYGEWFQKAMKYLHWRTQFKNYDMTYILAIDEPNPLITLPINHHVLFEKRHTELYKANSNISIPAEHTQVIQSITEGCCLWIDYTSDQFHSLKLKTQEEISFIKKLN
ncbi:hypothetical protein QFZ77_000235 [Paenibacillus sp. V4I3]|uniref:hypothetical protein n=1 Tax=Paenibacillus sp. V4I3 TaxID=3042305 RepID=UPI002783485B|nr:hypothetical protein [Paenibacillus sp. V4I3]MDQ0871576.1 hypothetical protein [Paenibacillus sp. V4I3]